MIFFDCQMLRNIYLISLLFLSGVPCWVRRRRTPDAERMDKNTQRVGTVPKSTSCHPTSLNLRSTIRLRTSLSKW